MTHTHLTAPTQFVEVDSTRFAYRRWGNSASGQPPLLMLQHFRGGMDHWDPLMTDGLAEGREVILFNGRGVASSGGARRARASKTWPTMLLPPSFVHFGLEAESTCSASRSGGMQALDLTWRHPESGSQAHAAGHGSARRRSGDWSTACWARPSTRCRRLEDFLYLFFGRSETARAGGHGTSGNGAISRVDQDPPSSPEAAKAQIEANRALPAQAICKTIPSPILRGILQPTFILNGVHDVMIPTVNSFYMARNLPNAQLFVYPDSGHAAQFQSPQRFLKHAVQFLSE